jgi:uncharacterized protein YjbJ (UPF0337 family)
LLFSQHRHRIDQKSMKERVMDWNRVQGNWKQVEGKVKEKWSKLTDNDLIAINGSREELEGKLQQHYGRLPGPGEPRADHLGSMRAA